MGSLKKLNKRNIIQIDLSSCKNWSECMKVIELITSGRVKIKVNEQTMETKRTKEEMDKSKTDLLNQLKEMTVSSDNLGWVAEQLDQTIDEEVERQDDKLTDLPSQPLSDLEGLEYFYTMYKRTVERGKPNQRMAEQLKLYIDTIQIKTLINEQTR